MFVPSVVHCIAVLVFQLWAVHTLSPIPACPDSCVCEKTLLVNCASLGLSKAPSHIPATAAALDLSHNALHSLAPLGSGHMHLRGLQHLWVGNNSLESLSLCSGIQGTRTLNRRKQRCVSWAPDLQSLSVDRNQLKCLPRGLGNIKSLKVLQLSHNRITEIGPADLAGCTHLTELQLQHNLINTIHPKAFKDLQKLKVLDVSYNLLATIPVPAYLSLRNLNVLVDISGNRWRCDCNLKTIRRWLSFDSELGNPAWTVVCFSPSHHSGKDLLDLEESDLACPQPVYNTPSVEKEVTVDEGMELILSCHTANQDFMHTRWWTPHGQISDSQQFFHISNATEHDAGLYVCVSGYQEEHVSVFNLRVRKRAHDRRLRREAQIGSVELDRKDNRNIERNVPAVRAVQQSRFVLAVCLSVLITFIVAFVLGVVLRPFLEKCYKQIRNKRNSTQSPSDSRTSSPQQMPYVNEGYSDTDDQEQEVHEGPRVTFGGVTEIHQQGSVPYYVTVEDSPSGSYTDVAVLHQNGEKKESLTKNIEVHKEVPLREENKEMSSSSFTDSPNAESSKRMQFEYIPEPEDTTEFKERSISPSSSLSSEQEAQMSYEIESNEQSVDSPTVGIYEDDEQSSTDHQATIPGFITDPFLLKMSKLKEECVDELDPDLWNDSGESFSFTEGSPRSSSRVSHVAALGYPLIQKEMSADEPSDRSSSCNSSESGESEGGPTEYTVNPEAEEDSETQTSNSENDDVTYDENRLSPLEKDILTEDQQTGTGARFRQDTITLDPTDMHMTYIQGDSFDEPFTEYTECFHSSNISSDYENEPTQYHVHPVYRTSQKTTYQIGEDKSSTSSYSEEEEVADKHEEYPRRLEIRLEHQIPSTDATPVISSDKLFNIDYDNSSSSTDIEDKHSKENKRGKFKGLSGISALLFNRGGSETNKALKPEPKAATTNSKDTGGFLGLSFKKQSMTPSEKANPTTNDENFFATIGHAFDRLPKLKNSLLFSISAPKLPHQQESTPVMDRISQSERPHVNSSFDDGIFGTIDQTLDPIPRVKRYLCFSQISSYPSIQALSSSIKEETIPHELVKYESKECTLSSEDDPSVTTKEDSVFGQIEASSDNLPKVKRYVQFSASESQRSSHSTSIKPVARPRAVPKMEPPSDTISIFFEGQSASLPAIPKVQRYVQFMQSELPSIHKLSPAMKEVSFFGQMHMSFDYVPKVKQYVQFSPSEPQHSSRSTSIKPVARPRAVPKTEPLSDTISIFFEGQSASLPAIPKVQRYVQFMQSEPPSIHKRSPAIKEDSFFRQMHMSFDEMPKVKQYVQFSPSEPQHSSRSTSIKPVARPRAVPKREPPSNTISIFFEGQSTSLPAIPKVQRYVQFMQSELPSIHKLSPAMKKDGFFGQMHMSFDDVPKVKQYVQFSPSESQRSSHSTSIKPVARPQAVPKMEPPSHTISIFFEEQSVSLPVIPKVQRYVQFMQSEPPTIHEPSFTIKEDTFFGQMRMSFEEMPEVKRYVQFSPSEPQHSSRSTSIKPVARPWAVPKTEPPSGMINIFFEGQSTSLPTIPKVQRYVQFMQSEPPSIHKRSPAIKEGSFFGQMHMSFDYVPKVKRYVQFSPSEPRHSSRSTSIKPVARPRAVPKTEPPSDTISIFFEGQSASLPAIPKVQRYVQFMQSKAQTVQELTPTIKEDRFFGQMRMSFDDLPKVKQYVQFSASESQCSSHSTSIKPVARPWAVPKTEPPSDTISIFFEGQSTSLPAIPKVQRYVQFMQSEPPSIHKRSPSIKEGSFFGQMHMSFDEMPKVKRYVQFSPSEPRHSSRSTSIKPVARPQAVPKTEPPSNTISIFFEGQSASLPAIPKVQRYVQFMQSKAQTVQELTPTFKEDSFFGQIPISFDGVPKVKRHILFSQSESHYQTLSPYHHSKKNYPPSDKQTPHEMKTYLVTGKDHAKYHNVGDDFFGQTATSLGGVPKIKKYIRFTQPEEFSEILSPYFPLNETIPTMQTDTEVKRNNSPSKDCNPAADEHNFFGQIGVFFDGIPKVRRRIQFTELSPQPQSSLKQPVTLAAKTKGTSSSIIYTKSSQSKTNFFEVIHVSLDNIPKVNRALHFTRFEAEASHQSIPSSFGQIGISFDEVPKVKRYLQFIKSEPQLAAQPPSTSVITEYVTPEFSTKTQSKRSEAEVSPSVKGNNLFVQSGTSLHGLPKLKRYLQFTQFELQSSAQSSSLPVITERVTPEQLTKTQSTRNEDKITRTIKRDDFFGQTGSSFNGLPKVKRYIQFTPAECHLQPPLLHSLTNRTEKTGHAIAELKIKDLAPKDYIQPAAGEHRSFGPNSAFSEIPKLRRYIQFSQHSTQPSSLPLPRQMVTPVLTKPELGRSSSSTVDSKTNNEDTFFKKIDASVIELPKVRRYIHFTHRYSIPTKSSNTHGVTVDIAKKRELRGTNLSMVDVKSPVTEDNFVGQQGINYNSLPRVNRYIQFAQSESCPSSQSQSPTELMTKKEWKTSSSSINHDANSSRKETFFDGASLDSIPKVKKALLFTQSEYQYKTAANDNLFGSLDFSFDQLPKVKRHIQTMQSEPHGSSPVPSQFLSRSNLESQRSLPSEEEFKLTTKETDSFDQLDRVPRLNRYIQFRQTEPHTQTPSPSISSQKWENMDVGTELRTNIAPATAGGQVLQQISTRTRKSLTFTNLDQYDQNTAQSLSWTQDTLSAVKVTTETSRLNQLPEPKRSPFSSNLDAYGQPDQVFKEEAFRQTSLSFSERKYAKSQGSSSSTASESETTLESKLSSLGALSNESVALQTRKRLVMDPAIQDVSQSSLPTSAASSGNDDTREYLRDSSVARQRLEQRRSLFQQKRRAMAGFSRSSGFFTSQESDQ